jgi:hypothetical protein
MDAFVFAVRTVANITVGRRADMTGETTARTGDWLGASPE